ncbi:1,2-phenylacetyl-CoA epoxidase subunit PaaD [Martelella sp. HB161492]|uniref:1,2-phenylacetyl-CoA epoxidase subunit PaaD n=1 Tax=Martelella sp. HB161492 TaxID=2720726 RepID=UPI0015924785|nr:1,2-phenylacetyl-CoA epoxidase subunit PaaD [Martelella sp. HB161492]
MVSADTLALPSPETVMDWLGELPDPEIPVISVTELGIVRAVRHDGAVLVVVVTPTYSGCPAVSLINLEIEVLLREKGVERLRIEQQLSPPWSTDLLSEAARAKLKAFGIAPPMDGTAADGRLAARASRLAAGSNFRVACPRCGSGNTEKVSQFGSTPCKASYRCADCLEPFDYFKCI